MSNQDDGGELVMSGRRRKMLYDILQQASVPELVLLDVVAQLIPLELHHLAVLWRKRRRRKRKSRQGTTTSIWVDLMGYCCFALTVSLWAVGHKCASLPALMAPERLKPTYLSRADRRSTAGKHSEV
ncbi:hypothetical protein EYF80_039759 [Liparis tanakae]|uniref:Uncharacterized protein n=1 Tax=Liparis tanakae TaxID=230148 RepID=A0A4Z2G935_9TELE|nr:hypothetical protein EYF80_039759 [Liparis tanakae]